MRRDLKELLRKAQRAGCTVSRTKRNHYKVRLPGGGCLHCPTTPSCPRGLKNLRADLRRRGLEI